MKSMSDVKPTVSHQEDIASPATIAEESPEAAKLKHEHNNISIDNDYIHPGGNPVWPRIRSRFQDYFCEFFGTLVIVFFGDSVVAQKTLSNGTAGDYLSINFGWALAVAFGIFVSGKSGAHLNPAVTISLAVFRGFNWRRVPGYIVAQMLGGLVGALLMYANYVSAIDEFEGYGVRSVGGATGTAGLFSTYPQPFLNKAGQFFSEFMATAVLMAGILAVTDNSNIGGVMALPAAVGLLVFAIGLCFGWETGYAINMARDTMPRLASFMLGYGREVWTAGNYYFWVPMVAPICGALFGGFLYDLLVYSGESPINMPYMGLQRMVRRGQMNMSKVDIEAPAEPEKKVHFQSDSQSTTPEAESKPDIKIHRPGLISRPQMAHKVPSEVDDGPEPMGIFKERQPSDLLSASELPVTRRISDLPTPDLLALRRTSDLSSPELPPLRRFSDLPTHNTPPETSWSGTTVMGDPMSKL
ncbi:hypothetical protein TD95_000891 [Thielaviopsis punctulata]|uniref:Aquaporin n=1 Tax=Thielaviopsis punctulata TaxID=72032 RepID=A0A0F4ZFG4_9PEZI|nr:hypothetical protein TD95_000891 [Thielaviopsis punctulata]